ncbi:PAS domain S-box protein [Thermithiobacillus plumbiphilus]|uniref:histidine kinase n=1 Tax=Thermithiobacillus plumbiphilus TaxID=1729899 RepID=A0ABU9D3Z5_9PROT
MTREEALASKQQTDNLIDQLPLGILVLDARLRVLKSNQCSRLLLSLDPASLAGRSLPELLPLPGLAALGEKIARGEAPDTNLEACWGGRELRIAVSGIRHINENALLLLILQGQKTIAEEDLADCKRNEELFELLLQGVRDYALIVVDPETRILIWNQGAERLFGYDHDEVLGRRGDFIFTPEDRAAGIPAEEMRIAREQGRAPDKRWHLRKDGSRFYCEGTVTSLLDDEGHLRGYAKVLEDRTAIRTAEEALRESETRFRLLMENVQDYAIFMTDIEGRVLEWNVGAERILGYRETEIIGHSASVIYTPEDRWANVPASEQEHALMHGQSVDERWHQRKDGSRFYASGMLFTLRDELGHHKGFAKILRDQTRQKLAEEEIQRLNRELETRVQARTAELVALNRELESFSYSVAHDLRAPLRAINSFSHALQQDSADCLNTEGVHHLGRIRQAAQRMEHLIDDLLKLAQVTRQEIRWENVDLSDLAKRIRGKLQTGDPIRQVDWIIAPHAMAQGDARLLEIALENLMSNAWKFTSKTPQARIEFGAMPREGKSVFYVRDNGAGFDMHYANRLFSAFQRLHSVSDFEGTGIGLATVARIIHRHGGHVWAEGAVNQGATFYFSLN